MPVSGAGDSMQVGALQVPVSRLFPAEKPAFLTRSCCNATYIERSNIRFFGQGFDPPSGHAAVRRDSASCGL